jgi:hypothetical protein
MNNDIDNIDFDIELTVANADNPIVCLRKHPTLNCAPGYFAYKIPTDKTIQLRVIPKTISLSEGEQFISIAWFFLKRTACENHFHITPFISNKNRKSKRFDSKWYSGFENFDAIKLWIASTCADICDCLWYLEVIRIHNEVKLSKTYFAFASREQ